ncbi:MAG: hypothetical protein RLZZ324_2 [Candidatus Parcubacteria bacterium]|jgi:hypothetical protein
MDAFFLPATLPDFEDTTATLPPKAAVSHETAPAASAPAVAPVAADGATPAPVNADAKPASIAALATLFSVLPAPAAQQETPAAQQEAPAAPALEPTTTFKAAMETPTEDAAANKIKVIVKALRAMEQNLANVIRLLEDQGPTDATLTAALAGEHGTRELELAAVRAVDGRVIEGVFDGREMVGSDGKSYSVPANYASKSKLVEGDMLKLTITTKGTFIYKQIGPIERARVVAELGLDATSGEFYATEGEKRWSVLKASVTFFKGEAGDEVVLLVPKGSTSKWAAVENIIKRNPLV